MDEWQTNKKSTKTFKNAVVSHSQSNIKNNKVSATNLNIKIITEQEFIQNKNKYTEVSYKLSELFDSINKMVSTSSQYLNSKQVNHNQHNHNKYHIKNSNDDDDISKIMICFNKLCINNYTSILNEIKELNIVTYEELKQIVNNIFNR